MTFPPPSEGLSRVPNPDQRCTGHMTLPPQRDGVLLRCQRLDDGHDLHKARDADGVLRVWPRSGPAHLAAVRPAPEPTL